MPPALARRPKLQGKDFPYRDAFHTLNAARQEGTGGPNPISVGEVLAYVMLMGIASVSERSKYLRLIQQLDGVYLTYVAEKSARAAK